MTIPGFPKSKCDRRCGSRCRRRWGSPGQIRRLAEEAAQSPAMALPSQNCQKICSHLLNRRSRRWTSNLIAPRCETQAGAWVFLEVLRVEFTRAVAPRVRVVDDSTRLHRFAGHVVRQNE